VQVPVLIKGPFSPNVDALFDEASKAVRARPEIVSQVQALDNPPDLAAVIEREREVLGSVVADQVGRYTALSERLHERLVVRLVVGHAEELEGLAEAAGALTDAIREATNAVSVTWHELRQYRLRLERRLNVVIPGRADPPEDPSTALDLELIECRRLLSELEARQVGLLAAGLSAANRQIEFRVQVTEWESLRRDIVNTLESAMFATVLSAVNIAVTEESGPRMHVTSFDGLRQSLTNEQIVITDVYNQVEGILRERQDGSFGIAGPRGVGKSTLINYVATSHRKRLGVVVSAPVAYEARDFVLHLYAELCNRVVGTEGQRHVRLRSGLYFLGPWVGAVLALGGGALAGGIGFLALAIARRLPWTWYVMADIGAALTVIAMLALVIATTSILRHKAVARHESEEAEPVGLGVQLSAAGVTALAVVGLMLLFIGGGWRGGTWLFLAGITLSAVAGLAIYIFAMGRQGYFAKKLFHMITPDNQIRELALDHLRQIRYQQSFSRERSAGLKIGSGLSVEVGGKQSETWEDRPKGYPELVADLRAFLAAVAERHTVVIGVDELDKLRSAEDVETFLNDIKGIFGATGCFFLVSVSEDAAAGFARRGIPFRDVFDSAFDDVISVWHLNLPAARKVLYGLLLGWTKPFVGLCYVMSGGLARDLRRSARELITYRNGDSEIELAEATLGVCRREGEARLRAMRHELMRECFDPAHADLLTLIDDLTATAAITLEWHRKLTAWADKQPADAPAIRLALELAAYLLLAATVIEFFDPATIAARMGEAEQPGAKGLATLASARRSLTVNPHISLARTTRFREAWGLTAI
jgi:hypothetical protein